MVSTYRCRSCAKLLFEAAEVRSLVKRCPRCGAQNVFDDAPARVIPRIIHRIWFGSEMPGEFVHYGETWRGCYPDWEVKLWSEDSVPRLENQELFDSASTLVPGAAEQFRADVARYEILWRFGGLYVDADLECRRSIVDLLGGVSLIAAWEVDNIWINNALLGCTAGHPFMRALIDGLPKNVLSVLKRQPNHMSGPRYVTRMFRELSPEMLLLPSARIYPYLWNELDREDEEFPEAFAIHRWWNRRKRISREFPRRC